jgi:hypothetical protein
MFIIMILLYVHVAVIVRGRDRMGSFTYVNTQLAHYVFTTLQFGCCLVRSLSYVKITLPQRILDTWYARRCDNVLFNVFVTYEYGLDAKVKTQT